MSEMNTSVNPMKEVKLITDLRKKESHNKVERRRRCQINGRIEELEKIIPNSYFTGDKRNKGLVLAATIRYVKQLEKDNQLLRRTEISVNRTEESIATLDAELKEAKRQLHTETFLQQNQQRLQSCDRNYIDQ